MDDHFVQIYRQEAQRYQALIAAEDTDEHLKRRILELTGKNPLRILDLGSGTGRIAQILMGQAHQFYSLDVHRAMLTEQSRMLSPNLHELHMVQAELSRAPFETKQFEVVIAAWAIGHICSWYPDNWEEKIRAAIWEMERLGQRNSRLIVIETMGTGTETAQAPSPELSRYYDMMREEFAFQEEVFATDYQFKNAGEAEGHMRFFFGDELGDRVRLEGWSRVPEWTGIWNKEMG